MTIFRQQHKIERKRGGNAALLFATFSSNDLVVSGSTMFKYYHSAAIWFVFR
jgi:hypothetical protein